MQNATVNIIRVCVCVCVCVCARALTQDNILLSITIIEKCI